MRRVLSLFVVLFLTALLAGPALAQSSGLTLVVDNPNVRADGSTVTYLRAYAFYQNANGVIYPASGALVTFWADYGVLGGFGITNGVGYAYTNSSGQAVVTYATIDTGGYRVYCSGINRQSAASVFPSDPGPCTVNIYSPYGGTYNCLSTYNVQLVPFGWYWNSTRRGVSGGYSPYELLHSVEENNCPYYPYTRGQNTAHYSSQQSGTMSFISQSCQFCSYNNTYVNLYVQHVSGNWNSYEWFGQSNFTNFGVAFS